MDGRPSRLVLSALAVAVAVVGCSAMLADSPAGDGGSSRRGARAAGGGREHRRPLIDEPVPSAWHAELGVEPTALIASGPEVFVTATDRLAAFDAASGRRRFSTRVPRVGAFVAANADTVAVATDSGFAAFDRATGDARWTVTLDPPAAGRQLAFVATDAGPVLVGATETGGLIGFDAATGDVRWSIATEGIPMGRLVGDERHGLVVAMTGVNPPNSEGSRKKMLRVLDAADGRLRWSRRFPVGTGTPALDDLRLMLISGPVLGRGRLLTFDLLTGVPGWSRPTEFSAEIGTGGVVDGDRLIVGDIGGTFYAVHRSTGRLSWKTDLTRLYLDGDPVVFGDTFVARDMSGEYHVFNRRTGRLRSRWLTIGSSVGYGVANGRFVHAQQGVSDSQVVAVPDEFRTARTPQRTDRGRERDDGRGRPATIEG